MATILTYRITERHKEREFVFLEGVGDQPNPFIKFQIVYSLHVFYHGSFSFLVQQVTMTARGVRREAAPASPGRAPAAPDAAAGHGHPGHACT